MVTAASSDIDLITGATADRIMRLAETAHTPGEFERLVELFESEAPVDWKPFGWDSRTDTGGRDPHSALGTAPDPALLLAEPVMNSFDALFELRRELRRLAGDDTVPGSPREAAHVFCGVHPDGLASWDTRRGDARKRYEQLAQMTEVVLLPGTSAGTPTICFRDCAIGQHPADFWRTILSLQLANKVDVPYMAGQYGHGAGMLLAFTNGGQVMISRRHPRLLKGGQDDFAGVVAVRKRMPSETGRMNPHYECLVSARTDQPFAFAPSTMANPSWHGLQRTCIDYELTNAAFQAIYDGFDDVLPQPPLPYELRDERDA
jgi:hypothetical protein